MKLLLHTTSTTTRLFDRCNDKLVILRFLAMAEVDCWCILAWDIETNIRDGYAWPIINAVLVFRRFSTRFFGVCQFFFRYWIPCNVSLGKSLKVAAMCQAKKWKLPIKPIFHFVKFRRICMGSSYQSKTGLVSSRQFATQWVLVFGK